MTTEIINKIEGIESSLSAFQAKANEEIKNTGKVAEETKKDSKGEVKTRQVKKQRTVPFSSKEADIANLLFTKSELIELKKEIGQCENRIHAELANNMKSLLKKAMK